jgi:hypothetical protein
MSDPIQSTLHGYSEPPETVLVREKTWGGPDSIVGEYVRVQTGWRAGLRAAVQQFDDAKGANE